MVSNIPRYDKQIHFCLSTDDPTAVDWQNGDLVFVMDQDWLGVYDADNSVFKEISLGGGGGGGTQIQAPYKVASGKYTPASNAFNANLPIAGSGITTIAAVFIECEDTVDYAVTYLSSAPVLLYIMYAYPHAIFGSGGNIGSDISYLQADGTLGYSSSLGGLSTPPTVQADTCYMKWTNGAPMKPGVTYNYFVLGV